jgi:histidyl-tRNA synthetase
VVPSTVAEVYVVLAGELAERRGLALVERWRDALPGVRIAAHLGGGSFKSQLKRADRSGAAVAVILGDGEAEREVAAIKPLRADLPQRDCPWNEVPEGIRGLLQRSDA